DRRTGDAGGGEPARPLVSLVGAQQGFFGEVRGRRDSLRNSRRADRRHWRRNEGNGLGVSPGAIAITDGEVETLAGKIDAIVVGLNAQVHERMGLAEGVKSRQEPSGCEGADDADADDAPEVAFLEPLQRRAKPAE